MKKLILSTLSVVLLSQWAMATAAKEQFKLINVTELSSMLNNQNAKAKIMIFDANNEDTRKKEGVIHNATLLPSSKHYEAAKILPADKKTWLVFYCANEKCMASHAAAQEAIKAKYENVFVLADGIQGWVKAGQPVDKL